jgi:hypothetical protein
MIKIEKELFDERKKERLGFVSDGIDQSGNFQNRSLKFFSY